MRDEQQLQPACLRHRAQLAASSKFTPLPATALQAWQGLGGRAHNNFLLSALILLPFIKTARWFGLFRAGWWGGKEQASERRVG